MTTEGTHPIDNPVVSDEELTSAANDVFLGYDENRELALPKQRHCVFCGAVITKSTASREHTVPKWLQEDLGIATASVQPTLTSPAGVQLDQRIHPVSKLLAGGICRKCNNGWMSQLESDVQTVLRTIMRSKRTLASLTKSERHALSRWAVKTAFVLDVAGFEARVPYEHLRELHSNAPHLPQNVYVFARQQLATQSWYYIEGAWWKHAALSEGAAERVAAKSYKIALQFRDLILVVVHWPLTDWGIRIEKGEMVKLWPPAAVVKEYVHPEPLESSASDRACLRYATTISVVPKRGAEGRA